MKLIQLLRDNKSILLTLTLLTTLTFIYGCQCEGGIGTSSENSDTIEIVNTQLESK